MLTQEEIEKMFEDMGLGSEKERERFNKLNQRDQDYDILQNTFIIYNNLHNNLWL